MPGVSETFSWRSRKTGETLTVSKLRSIIALYRSALEKQHTGPRKASSVNSLIRSALQAAGEMWIKVFLPKRFDPAYAKGVLGYHATSKYEDEKAANVGKMFSFTEERGFSDAAERTLVVGPQPTPFVLTGTSRAGVLSGANVEARVTANKWVLKVHVNPGSISFTKQYKNFMKIPTVEYQRVVWEVNHRLSALIKPSDVEKSEHELPERQVSNG